MSLELKQQLKMTQQLVMTPQLQQAITLLQLSRMELVDLIRTEIIRLKFADLVKDSGSIQDLHGPRLHGTKRLPLAGIERQDFPGGASPQGVRSGDRPERPRNTRNSP